MRSLPCTIAAIAWKPGGGWRLAAGVALLLVAGCQSWDVDSARRVASIVSWTQPSPIDVRKRAKNPLAGPLQLVGWGGPRPDERVEQLLRRYDLDRAYESDPTAALERLQDEVTSEPRLDTLHALAQLQYIQAEKANARGDHSEAAGWYGGAMIHAYDYLFDERLDAMRNAYDPVFRQVCDIYNQSLEGLLRMMAQEGSLRPDSSYAIEVCGQTLRLVLRVEGRWADEPFEDFKFASDYDTTGLNNRFHTYGLGVPLIAIRGHKETSSREEKYYPPGLTMPLTAFFQSLPSRSIHAGDSHPECHAVVHLVDPLEQTVVTVRDRVAPLESDITTPLALYLNDPLLKTNVFATIALIDADFAQQFNGLYMLEPFDPNKIPVVMVHGLWSSPVTWTEMFNDLRAMPEISRRYQFWFYLYPSGQPFWVSARQFRDDLATAREVLDPQHQYAALDEMVLVGHSMGGLVSRLQTLDSGEDFWRLASQQPIDAIQADSEVQRELERTFYFSPNPSIKRVITLGTPHRGSDYANTLTRWISHTLFRLPGPIVDWSDKLLRDNPEALADSRVLRTRTSVDSLATDSPFFDAMLAAHRAPWVKYYNVVGQTRPTGVARLCKKDQLVDSDGVVALSSARTSDVAAEQVVEAEHSSIHQHPLTIRFVYQVLRDHLAEVDARGSTAPSTDAPPVVHEADAAAVVPLEPLMPRHSDVHSMGDR